MAAMATVTASHVPRFSSRTCLTLWLGWLAVAAALCVPPLLWHFDYANAGHPRLYWLFVGALLAAALIVPPLYQSLRRKRLWRYEPLLLSAFAVAALLFYEPRATLVTAWIFLAAYGTGRFLRERLRAEVDSAAAEIAIVQTLVDLVPLYLVGGQAGDQIVDIADAGDERGRASRPHRFRARREEERGLSRRLPF